MRGSKLCYFICQILVFSSIGKLSTGCSITLPDDIPQYEPVYFLTLPGETESQLWKPTGQVTSLPVGAKLLLACVGSGNTLVPLSQQSLELTCRKDGTFYSQEKSKKFTLSQLNCLRIPTAEIKQTSNECGGSNQAYYIDAGFPWDNEFGSLFTVCYDNTSEHTLYSRNIINGAAMNYNIPESTRRAFRANGMQFTTTAVNNFYTQKNQVKRFETYFGSSQPYITSNNYLARGHLAPDADFILRYEQLATYFYINVVPQFQVVNAGNWLRVESAARKLAIKLGSDVLAFTGALGVLDLPKSNNQMQSIYLDSGNYFPASVWNYKVLMHPSLPNGLVMISLNNPFANAADIVEFCPNVCATYGVDSPNFADVNRGYTFCCTLDDFQQAVPDLPTFDLPAGW